nr:protein NRT1/ PTR FAMILY 1.2-like [Ipomoea trifida]
MEKMKDLEKESAAQVIRAKKGGMKTMPFVIANETFERVATVGLAANMILYLVNEYHFDNVLGANIMSWWVAISYFTPIFGAFLSDSYLGRYLVISLGTFTSLIGIILLWLTALLKSARPPPCTQGSENCEKPNSGQLAILFTPLALMAVGAGGIRPCSLAFGADQFDNPDNPNNKRILQTFFNWYYASVGVSIIVAATVIVYIQTEKGWVVGFGVPAVLMLVAAVMFLVGSRLFVKVKPNKSLLTGFYQVVVAAWKNRHLDLPEKGRGDCWYYGEKGSKLTSPSDRVRFLNKACLVSNPETDLKPDGSASDPRRLCTVKQVEGLKSVFKVLPLWSTGIIISVTISQHSFPVLQATTLDRHFIGNFQIPPGSFFVFSILTLTIWVAIYDRLLVPLIAKRTNNPRGLGLRQRMGIGLILSCLAMAAAALVERERRARAIRQGLENKPLGLVDMSGMWLILQNCLSGLGEAFNAIGQIEFYYSQFPKNMTSIGVSLFSLGMGFGNLVASLIVVAVNHWSKHGGKVSWVDDNFNKGHYDYYYWVLCFLSIGNFFYFLLCSWAFGSSDDAKIWDDDDDDESDSNKEGGAVMH